LLVKTPSAGKVYILPSSEFLTDGVLRTIELYAAAAGSINLFVSSIKLKYFK
jgi:hypothetical protein